MATPESQWPRGGFAADEAYGDTPAAASRTYAARRIDPVVRSRRESPRSRSRSRRLSPPRRPLPRRRWGAQFVSRFSARRGEIAGNCPPHRPADAPSRPRAGRRGHPQPRRGNRRRRGGSRRRGHPVTPPEGARLAPPPLPPANDTNDREDRESSTRAAREAWEKSPRADERIFPLDDSAPKPTSSPSPADPRHPSTPASPRSIAVPRRTSPSSRSTAWFPRRTSTTTASCSSSRSTPTRIGGSSTSEKRRAWRTAPSAR